MNREEELTPVEPEGHLGASTAGTKAENTAGHTAQRKAAGRAGQEWCGGEKDGKSWALLTFKDHGHGISAKGREERAHFIEDTVYEDVCPSTVSSLGTLPSSGLRNK